MEFSLQYNDKNARFPLKQKKSHTTKNTMKAKLMSIVMLAMVSLFSSHADAQTTYTCTSETQTTQEMGEAHCQGRISDPYFCDGDLLFRRYKVYLKCSPGWHFSQNPKMHCMRDNDGSFSWNGSHGSTGFDIQTSDNTPTSMTVTFRASSHSIDVQVWCEAAKD
jgi:hypothetical protein